MKFHFKNSESVYDALRLVKQDIGIELADENTADITVTVVTSDERTVRVTLDGKNATVTYGDGKPRFLRGLAILADWVRKGETCKSITETPLFATNGAMVDMSRNAVMNVKTVKTMLRKMALMGLNTFMLYTEDTYELDGYAYFGYMRGRYTKDEIREIDRYAVTLGIELVPCVQMLGHLATHLRWSAANPYKDTANAMLVGADETYAVIESMLKTISECFTSRRIHVGMDETKDLGTGAYLSKNGYRERRDIYFEHLEKVIDMCQSFGFKPMMWSDMFFRMSWNKDGKYYDYHPDVEFTEDVIAKIPQGIQQVFWDYYRPSEEFYTVNIDKHRMLFKDGMLFAGGIWTWSGHCPLFSRSLAFTIPALDACRKKKVDEVFATIWLNGAECSLIMGLLGLAWYADYDYSGGYDADSVRNCFERSCNADYDEIKNCDCPEGAVDSNGYMLSTTREFLYNDPLLGLVDKHIEGYDTQTHFKNTTALLQNAKADKGVFESSYDVILKLSSLLENKADFGVRLKKAYDEKNTALLSEMVLECDVIISKLSALRESHFKSWMEYNKPFGFEVHDIRYGGLICRFDTVKARLNAFLDGSIEKIEELEENRLRIDGKLGDNVSPRFDDRFLWHKYNIIATPSIL